MEVKQAIYRDFCHSPAFFSTLNLTQWVVLWKFFVNLVTWVIEFAEKFNKLNFVCLHSIWVFYDCKIDNKFSWGVVRL
jgi:hypothetical protein